MSGGGNTSTVTNNTKPPQQFEDALANVGQQAMQTGQTPYQPYTGNLVAPLSPDQQAGIQGVQNLQGITSPYINAAAQFIGNSTDSLQPYIEGSANHSADLSNLSAANAANLPGSAQPGINQANGLYNLSARQLNPTQFSAGNVQQYESPYTRDVVNATQAQFNNQNQQQQQSVEGNAVSQGAFGGDREAVAQGITAGQQQMAQAPVIAGLQNQGYAQALNEFNQQQQIGLSAQQATQQLQQGAGQGILAGNQQYLGAQQAGIQGLQGAAAGNLSAGQAKLSAAEANAWLNSQAGFGMGNLGNEALNNGLQESNALLGTGGLEQQQAQQSLNIPYEQYTAAQAYPFQTEAWLSGLEGQLANAAGGTASTTQPGASPISQVAGLGITGLAAYGLANQAGLLGGGGGGSGFIDSGAFGEKRGGAVPHRAGGGHITGQVPIGIPSPDANISLYTPAAPPDVSNTVVGQPSSGGGIQKSLPGIGVKNSTTTNPNADSGFGTVAKTAGTIAAGIYGGPLGAIAANALGSHIHFSQGGGIVQKRAAGGVAIPHLPTSGGGIVNISSKGGVSIPQLSTAGGGGGSGIAGVNSYLANTAATAYHPPPPAPSPSPSPAGPVAPPTPPPAPQDVPSGGLGILPSGAVDFGDPAVNSGYGGGPMRRGGGIMRRDDGGPIMDLSGAEDDTPGGISGNGPFTIGDDANMPVPPIPPAPRRGGVHESLPVPPIPPDDVPPQATPGAGITGSSGGPPPPPVAGEPSHQDSAAQTHVPWETLLAAGLGIMGGSSPHALVNIGRGGMEGLQFGEQQRVRDENAALRRLQQEDLNAYRQAQVQNTANKTDIYGQRVGVFRQEADTHAQAIQNTDAYRHAVIANRRAGLDEKTANDKALQDIRQQRADTALYGAFSNNQNRQRALDQGDTRLTQSQTRLDQGQARVDQGDTRLSQGQARVDQGQARIEQAAQRIAASQEAQQARLALTQRGQDMASATADVAQAAHMFALGAVPSFALGLQQVQAGRATQHNQSTASPQAGPVADPLGFR